jgi:hypothetical protein
MSCPCPPTGASRTGTPSLRDGVEDSDDAGFPDEIAPRPEDYVFLKRRPSAFHGTGVAERCCACSGGTSSSSAEGRPTAASETSVREAWAHRSRSPGR